MSQERVGSVGCSEFWIVRAVSKVRKVNGTLEWRRVVCAVLISKVLRYGTC